MSLNIKPLMALRPPIPTFKKKGLKLSTSSAGVDSKLSDSNTDKASIKAKELDKEDK